jgi:hypothetical protein
MVLLFRRIVTALQHRLPDGLRNGKEFILAASGGWFWQEPANKTGEAGPFGFCGLSVQKVNHHSPLVLIYVNVNLHLHYAGVKRKFCSRHFRKR